MHNFLLCKSSLSPLTYNRIHKQTVNKMFGPKMLAGLDTLNMLCVYSACLWRWGMTHWSAMYALVVEQSFLQGDFFCSDLLPCHILSAGETIFTNGFNTHFRLFLNSEPVACFKIYAVFFVFSLPPCVFKPKT